MTPLLGTLVRHTGRNLRTGGLPLFFAVLMTFLGLYGLATFGTVMLNFQRLTAAIGHSVGAVAFLDVERAADAEDTRARIALLPGVEAALLVSPDEALARVQDSLEGAASGSGLLEGGAGLRMPWVVEVAPSADASVPIPALLTAIERTRGVEEVMHPGGDIERIDALTRLLSWVGLFLTLLVGLVTVVVVSNSIKLTLFARRSEIAIMKLVGATDAFVRVPFVALGVTQGLGGAVLAIASVYASHGAVAAVLEVALSGSFGVFELRPLPLVAAGWLLLGGALLGGLGATVSIRRFLRV